jgi:predicted DNA-binding transcriptional regulator YafY
VKSNKTARWLDLLAYLLQHRFPVTREDIFSHVAEYRADLEARNTPAAQESLRRKFERDKDELRALGIDLETVELPGAAGDEPATGYRLRERDLYLPYLELRESGSVEATGQRHERPYANLLRIVLGRGEMELLDRATRRVADLDGSPLAAAARSARGKLAFDLPLPLGAVERLLAHPLTGDAARALEVLQQAVSGRVAVRCKYHSIGRDAEEERVIEPYGLFFNWGHWYTAARSRERDAMRVFRLDRMSNAKLLTGAAAEYSVPPDFSIRDYVGRPPWELSAAAPVRAVVRFGFPEGRWVAAQGVGEVVEEVLGDGGALIAFAVRDRGPFLRWLLTFRAGVEIHEPVALARELSDLRQRVAALYATADR